MKKLWELQVNHITMFSTRENDNDYNRMYYLKNKDEKNNRR